MGLPKVSLFSFLALPPLVCRFPMAIFLLVRGLIALIHPAPYPAFIFRFFSLKPIYWGLREILGGVPGVFSPFRIFVLTVTFLLRHREEFSRG